MRSQQDAHELLRTLLAALADEREVKDEKDVLQRLVQRSFQGLICEAILCWSCRQVTVRHEFFLDLSLDIAEEDLDTGPLGLRGWAMKPLIVPEEEEDEAPAVEEPAPDGLEDQVIQVQLERVPGRRIPLGLEWQDAAKHNCKVLRRVHPNSLADQWNKRSGNGRLVPNLLLLSVNGEEDAEEIMQVLKDEAKLLLRFAPEEVVSARVNEKTQQGFQIELQRDAKTPWGFQLDPAALEEGNLIVAQILPDSVLDAWNLRCRSMGRKQQLVHCGDKILAVNGSRELQQMTKALNSQARQKNVVLLEPGDRGGYSAPSSAPAAEEDATFQVELEPMVSNSSWGFQLERMDGDDVAARVKGLEEGSPVALWNMVCRSRGDEHLCVEADDVLLDAKNAMAAASATPRSFTLRRSRDRQASVRAGGLDRTTARTASAAPRGTAAMEDLRQTMLHAAHGCAAQLAAEASPLATLFGAATPRPRAVSLADCVRNLGSIEALEENFQPIYHCSCCGSDAPRRAFASKRTWLQQLPPVLPVQLKRFRFDAHTGSFQKSRMRIQTTSTLDLSDLILSSDAQLGQSLGAMESRPPSSQVADSFIRLEVSLPSGRCETVTVSQGGTIADLKVAVQKSLGQSFLRLVGPGGLLLDSADPLPLSGLHDGDSLTAVALKPKIAATDGAFALWCPAGGGRVVAWNHPANGGDSSSVQDQLRNVQQIRASSFAFAAILEDGTVVTWGDPKRGGDSSRVQNQLRNVQQICGSMSAFAAILEDRTVVTWGDPKRGGDSSKVQDQLRNVQQICGSMSAFAAILEDGTVVTWGDPESGGDSSKVQDQLRNVQQICGSMSAFAAILENRTVVTWGDPEHGGDSPIAQDQIRLRNVQQIRASSFAFAAILEDRTVVTWGNPKYGGDSSKVENQLRNVQQICCSMSAFAAIVTDGKVVTWGDPERGGDSSRVQDQLRNVQQICGSMSAFAAILEDRTVVTWGDPHGGGDSSRVKNQFRYV
eukprot:s1897_g13.t1